jgi:hypothetical protein
MKEHPGKELYQMINVIEMLMEDETFIPKFCKDCPAVSHIPGDVTCPADFEPFYNAGCVKSQAIAAIEAVAREFEAVTAEAVA